MQGEAKEGAGSGGADRLGGLKSRIDGLAGLLTQLEAARSGARRARLGVVIVIIIVMIGYGWAIYRTGREFVTKGVDQIVTQGNKRLAEFAIQARQELLAMGKRVAPIYLDEAKKELNKAWPAIRQQLEDERDTLLSNVKDQLQSVVDERIPDLAARQEQRVLEEFKDIMTDEKKTVIMRNLDIALREATLNVLDKRINESAERLRKTRDEILEFLPEGQREPFKQRMEKLWDIIALEALKGKEMIDEGVTIEME